MPFIFDTIESDFRQFAQILGAQVYAHAAKGLKEKLGAQVNDNATKNLVENVDVRLRELNDRKFLFIILNVLDFEDIEVYVNRFISLTNVKFYNIIY